MEELQFLDGMALTYEADGCPILFEAVLVAEDRRFLRHPGFDFRAMARAGWDYTVRGRIGGASTIDQQLVRIVRNRYEFTLRRKVGEVLLASAINYHFSKRRIFALYMERAYFGWRGNGLSQICERLECDLLNLSLDQACMIAALIKTPLPSLISEQRRQRIESRRQYILRKMRKSGAT